MSGRDERSLVLPVVRVLDKPIFHHNYDNSQESLFLKRFKLALEGADSRLFGACAGDITNAYRVTDYVYRISCMKQFFPQYSSREVDRIAKEVKRGRFGIDVFASLSIQQ